MQGRRLWRYVYRRACAVGILLALLLGNPSESAFASFSLDEMQDVSAIPAVSTEEVAEEDSAEWDGIVEEIQFPEAATFDENPWDRSVPAAADDLTYADVLQRLDGQDFDEPGKVKIGKKFPNLATEEEILDYFKTTYPSTRNQTTKGVHYGSCWAHAAAALAEFYMIRHNLSDAIGPVTPSVNYSELQLAYFCYHDGALPANGDTGDHIFLDLSLGKGRNFLNLGGNLAFAAQSLMRGNGYARDKGNLAYSKAEKALKKGISSTYATEKNVATLKHQFFLNLWENPELVKEAILANGAVGISYFSRRRYLQKKNHAYYNYKRTFFNHVVTVVGWDDNYPAENFKKTPPGNGAWLVRNSHSKTSKLSEKSYFWLSYYDTSLGVAAYAYEMADQSKGEVYDNSYFHDGQLHLVRNASSTKVANVFTAVRQDETLEAVQFDATCFVPGKYRVSIYKNPALDDGPESGALVEEAVTMGEIRLSGKYTIRLDAPVELSRGETFAVVLETEKPIDREYDGLWKEQLVMDTVIFEGESFVFKEGAWEDLSRDTADGTRGNLCLRALTNTVKWVANPDTRTGLMVCLGI